MSLSTQAAPPVIQLIMFVDRVQHTVGTGVLLMLMFRLHMVAMDVSTLVICRLEHWYAQLYFSNH